MTNFTDNDRKLIIQHDVKLTEMCKTLNKMDEKIDKLDEKIDDNVKTYITKRMFLSINGIIIALVISLFTYTATIQKQVIENTVNISHIQNGLEKK